MFARHSLDVFVGDDRLLWAVLHGVRIVSVNSTDWTLVVPQDRANDLSGCVLDCVRPVLFLALPIVFAEHAVLKYN